MRKRHCSSCGSTGHNARTCEGEKSGGAKTSIQAKIVNALRGHRSPETAEAIARHIGGVAGTVGRACETLHTGGLLIRGPSRDGQKTYQLTKKGK